MRAWREQGGDSASVLVAEDSGFDKRTRRHLRTFGVAFQGGQLVRTATGCAEIRPVAGARASVVAATDGLSLVVQGPDFEWVAPCRPADREAARRLSSVINTASRQIAEDEAFWATLPR